MLILEMHEPYQSYKDENQTRRQKSKVHPYTRLLTGNEMNDNKVNLNRIRQIYHIANNTSVLVNKTNILITTLC